MPTAVLTASDTGRPAGNYVVTEGTAGILDRSYATSSTRGAHIGGDSHMANWAPYAAALGTMLGRPVAVDGIGGQQSVDIAARLGGMPPLVTVAGGFIPTSGAVAVTIAGGIRPLRSSGSLSRPAILGGVGGALATGDGGVTYTFTRSASGYAVPIPATGSPLVMGVEHRDELQIFSAPRNDIGRSTADTLYRATIPEIVARYEAMIAWRAPSGRFLMLSMLPWSDETPEGTAARLATDAVLRDLCPQQWLDWAAWLRTDAAFASVGATKTTQDSAGIAAGFTPPTFLVDAGHLNATGYAAANVLVAPSVLARGW
ncbi:hypothetical protein ASF87_16750 [Microbacterium sp. Leaf161]|uniref:hypothetical protein n=1 Tax=Microbacterium sp. Leaf161 TaxID=1736281 RepID=UPI0006FCC0DE|nr:hypothetical protein [Microbacterium sp. Leaf161]KQR43439.1 hypothetical protein ASF87_16750 [Microbacterium sp. Leaf161]